jgi:uroporphyrinogen III methyltransferase/synthase
MTSTSPQGIVYLIGAGPGDPGLLTVRGARLLELADVVVYDHLANPRLLGYCPRAELIYVGKQSSAHTLSQEQINALLTKLGFEGKRVVRLKGGDPFVFGRGGEECLALAEAGVRFEVVPGVTSAIAAAAYAGIPITHRDLNSSFTLITGHESTDEGSDIAWPVIAKLPCLAFYMGVAALPKICQRLIENGMPADMPAATIQWGTTPKQKTVTATVGTLPEAVVAGKIGTPAMTIIGKVVTLRQTLSWFENRPLFGQTIVVTRTRRQASELSQQLEDLGATVIEAPTIDIVPPANWDAVDAALAGAPKFDWIIFTSANGVQAVRDRLLASGKDIRALGNGKLAAIGPATADAIERDLCRKVDLCPERFVAEALGDELIGKNAVAGKRFLLLRAEIARPILRDMLISAGAAEVSDVAVYETRRAEKLPEGLRQGLEHGQINWITFTSSSTVKNFLELLGPEGSRLLQGVKLAAIGPITAATLTDAGLTPTVVAGEFTIDGVVSAMVGRP